MRILTEPKNALVKQYVALMETEGIKLRFLEDAIDRIADFATRVNERTENIGARRLHTVMERLLDEISFEGPDLRDKIITIDAATSTDARGDREERRSLPLHSVMAVAGFVLVRTLRVGKRLRVARKALRSRPSCCCPTGHRPHGEAGRRRHRLAVQIPGQTPMDRARPICERVEVYAHTGPLPTTADFLKYGTLVHSIDIKQPPDAGGAERSREQRAKSQRVGGEDQGSRRQMSQGRRALPARSRPRRLEGRSRSPARR